MQNQRRLERTEWKESAICTKSWNNSVLQFIKVSDLVDPEAGFLHRSAPPVLSQSAAAVVPIPAMLRCCYR